MTDEGGAGSRRATRYDGPTLTSRPLLAGGLLAAAFAFTQPACEASLEPECVGGDGTCDIHDLTPESGPCYEGCDTGVVSGQTGEYPCEVDAIIDACRPCHVEGSVGPFSLDTYADSQELFAGTAVWARLQGVLIDDRMPQGGPPLSSADKTAILDDWACQCAPPRPAGETCN